MGKKSAITKFRVITPFTNNLALTCIIGNREPLASEVSSALVADVVVNAYRYLVLGGKG